MDYSSCVYYTFQRACVRAICFNAVVDLDIEKREGRIWLEEEYQKALARIRDYGVMHGLTAKIINETFIRAHTNGIMRI